MTTVSDSTRDVLIQAWQQAAEALVIAKATEMKARLAVTEALFPNPDKGTQRVELGRGYAIKLVHKLNYTFPDKDKLDAALAKIEATGNEGTFIADRLVKYEPKLSLTEYNKLAQPYADIINEVMVVKPAAPSIEIEEPKVKL